MTTFKAYLNSQRDVDSSLGRFIGESRLMSDMPGRSHMASDARLPRRTLCAGRRAGGDRPCGVDGVVALSGQGPHGCVSRRRAAAISKGDDMSGSRQKQLLGCEDWSRVQAIRQVAHALSLYTSGKFRAPRMFMVGPLARTMLTRADNDNDGLADAMAEADLLAQTAEIRALGLLWPVGLNDSAVQQQPPRKAVVLNRTAVLLEQLWPAIQELSGLLIGQGTLLGSQFSEALDSDLGFNSAKPRLETRGLTVR